MNTDALVKYYMDQIRAKLNAQCIAYLESQKQKQ